MKRPRNSARVGAALGLMVAVSLLLTQCGTSSSGIPDGPGMLYFYAEW